MVIFGLSCNAMENKTNRKDIQNDIFIDVVFNIIISFLSDRIFRCSVSS